MIETSLSTFLKDASSYCTIPMSTTIVADTKTPIQLFQLFNDEAAFILESKDPLSTWSNYSFIGLSPSCFLLEKNGKFILKNKTGENLINGCSFQEVWERSMAYFNIAPNWPDIPFPGGAVGFFSFEAYGLYENKVQKPAGESAIHLVFCETILAFNHQKEELTLLHLQKVNQHNPTKSYHLGKAIIEEKLTIIQKGKRIDSPTVLTSNSPFSKEAFEGVSSNYKKADFISAIQEIKKYIEAGDIFQGVLSQRFDYPVKSSGLDLYRVLRKVNPSPYLYYLRLGDQEIIGSSPERLVKVDQSREIEIHPIAGTRPRGTTMIEDEKLADELRHDAKEQAEHLMLVDLARNDLGRVSEFGSIKVEDMMNVTYFSHVMHMITKVKGQLREDVGPFEALFSAHPAGTVSGAPKVRAVEIIQELEKERRGVYAGAIAYCGWNGALDSCIAIRTIILKNGVASVQAGAGIVHDSVPEAEWEETRNKARALLVAIKIAEQRFERQEAIS